MFLFNFPESGKNAWFGLGKDKVIPWCSPRNCVSIFDPQVGGSLIAAAAFGGAAQSFPCGCAAAGAAASGALLFVLVVSVSSLDPLFLRSGMVLLRLFALSSVMYLIEENDEYIAAAASVVALFLWQEVWMVAAAASDGLFVLVFCYWCLEAVSWVLVFFGLATMTLCHEREGSRFASVQAEATPRVDVDETPCCTSPHSGVDITSLKTSSFQVFVSVPGRSTAVAWVSGCVSLKEVALGLGLDEWVDEGLIYAMVGSRAHDLRVHVGSTGLVRNSTLRAGNRIHYPDEWTCGRCRMGGCWSTKTTCFRCGARRDFGNGVVNPQVIPPRERNFPGRPAQMPRPSKTACTDLKCGRWIGQLSFASDYGAVGSFRGCHE